METYDVAVIGAGPGGYVAAIRAAQLGARVAVIERDRIGGTCLNRGCIPTKAVLQSVEVHRTVAQADAWGVVARLEGFDLAGVRRFRDELVSRMVKGVETLLRAHGVAVLRGSASFVDPHTLQVEGEGGESFLSARNFIIATGSVPARPSIPGLDLPGVVDSDEITRLEEVPRSLSIVGAGVIGMELATVFRGLGSEVTVLEMLPRILPPTDKAVATRFLALAKRRGIRVLTSVRVESIELVEEAPGPKLRVNYSRVGKETPPSFVEAEKVLVAVGRRPNAEGLNLEAIGVETERGTVVVDETMRTSLPHVYAVGDCVGGAMLAHKASYEGEIAAENALGRLRRADYTAIPYCIYTHPEIAGVGLTEETAKEAGADYEVATFPFTANARAWALNASDGLVKLIYEKGSRKLLGAHVMGPWAGELIGELTLAVRLGLKADEIAGTVHPHPTLSEAVMEAAKAAVHGEAIHYFKRRRR